MPNVEQLEKLKALLESLPEDAMVSFDDDLSDDCEWVLQPITMSCDDDTIVGWVVVNKPTTH